MLPTVHATATQAAAGLSERDRTRLIAMLTTIRTELAAMAHEPPASPPSRKRPRRRRPKSADEI
jgi:hypothetical protein